MKVPLYLQWNEPKQEWHLLDHEGYFVYELRDCKNMNRMFDMPKKDGEKHLYIIDIHMLNRSLNGNKPLV